MSDPYRQLLGALSQGSRVRTVGLHGAHRGWVLARLARDSGRRLIAITADDDASEALAADLAFFMGGAGTGLQPTVARIPADEVLPWDELVADPTVIAERLGTLTHLAKGTPMSAVVLSARAAVKRVLPGALLTTLSSTVAVGDDIGRDSLARRLDEAGYRNTPLVEDSGTFSVRGDILDVYPPLYELPVRLEFFGDTVESMRAFDPGTQRTLDAMKVVELIPARELLFNPQTRRTAEASVRAAAEQQDVPTSKVRERIEQIREGVAATGIEALLPGFYEGGLESVMAALQRWAPNALVWVDEPAGVERTLEHLGEDIERSHSDAVRRKELSLPPSAHFLDAATLKTQLQRFAVVEGGGLSLDGGPSESAPVHFSASLTTSLREAIASHHGEEGALAPLVERLETWRDEGLLTVVACSSKGQLDRLKRLLLERNISARGHELPPAAHQLTSLVDPAILAHLVVGEVSQGFIDTSGQLAVIADEDIFGARAHRKTRRRKTAMEGLAASFKDLKDGDLCVHADFGVCRYGGLVTMRVNEVDADFLVLHFAGRDKVYLPVGRLRLVSKFTGGDPSTVALDKLGSGSWEKKKLAVREQLLKMAAELLQLYAQRKAHPGHAFSKPDRYFHQFEADFEFDETPDQQKAIDDVLADMQKPEPMDRLVCGDVGYGKTEVAMRAAFKAVLDRKQVAVLVPTTLLAHQHLASFTKRFAGYPVSVEVVSSLRKTSETREIMDRAAKGRVDVVIGTHKLLSSNVSFRDLGLLIVDEEQKFGVKQKESLKRLKTNVDTLVLSATPIPRTLNMALSGMRDLSLITTPPADRRAIRTFVNRFGEGLIKEAIQREVLRGGQVFFVHNRVESLGTIEKLLRELVPNVSMVVAHGQMGEGELEKVMMEFVEGRAQMLLTTTIIESGLDISRANTLIVNRADQFGLSQLYQLRGRVGRSKERAYAYLLVPEGRAITKDAERRLEVLQSFTELGAGFNIASHDLEIRGAGSLLGKEQSGSIEAVGFDLYAQMLEEAIAEVRGEPIAKQVEPELNLPLPAFLPEMYVPDVHQRLVLYKRLSQATTPEELDDLRAELVDRFGEPPDEVDQLHEVMMLRQELRRLALRQLDGGPGRLVVTFGPDARIDGNKLAALVQRSKGIYRLTPDMKLIVKLDASVQGAAFLAAARKVLSALHSVGTA